MQLRATEEAMKRYAIGCAALLWVLIPACVVAEERWLQGIIVRPGEYDDLLPEINVTVSMHGIHATTTNALGRFRLPLPDIFKVGTEVLLHVDKPGWRIQRPPEGKTRIPADLHNDIVDVLLLPVDTKLFWSHTRIEHAIADLAEKSTQPLTPDHKLADFSRYIEDWAAKYGFSFQQAQEEIVQWITEVQANQDDLSTLGIAAFAEKDFRKASQLFNAAAMQKEQRLAEIKKDAGISVEEIVRDFRREGAAHVNNYMFDEALTAYQRALSYLSKEHRPQVWAAILNDIGAIHWQRGIRATDTAMHPYLTVAIQAYRQALEISPRPDAPHQWALTQANLGMALQMQGEYTTDERGTQLLAEAAAAMRQALEVYTRPAMPQQWVLLQTKLGITLRVQGERTVGERGTQLLAEAAAALRQALEVYTWADVPQDWAATQNSLGITLRAQGERTAGERGTQLLAEAVATYRQALEVRTRAAVPQDWAATQNNLGNALQAQGERTVGERGTQLLTAAVAAFRQAMEVYTRADAPRRWAIVQNNVAKTYMLLKDWPNALTSYLHVLHADPEYQEAYQAASYLSHEVFFQFPQAFALNQQWLERHPADLGTLSDYAERHFTTSRFAECDQRLTALLVNPDVEPQTIVALRAIEIANLLALEKAARVPGKIDTMLETISKQPEDFKVTWAFGGTLHFISQYAPLAPHRDWLQQFFGALIDTDRQAMVTGLQVARASFPAGEK